MGTDLPPVSDAELQVLKALWSGGPGTVREVESRLRKRRNKWAYNTLLTLLSRLREKGYVSAEKGDVGGALRFSAAASRQQLLRNGLSELADRICDGTSSPLLHALVEGGKLSSEDVARLRQLLDELDSK
jgi:predicted transcriptional regulator